LGFCNSALTSLRISRPRRPRPFQWHSISHPGSGKIINSKELGSFNALFSTFKGEQSNRDPSKRIKRSLNNRFVHRGSLPKLIYFYTNPHGDKTKNDLRKDPLTDASFCLEAWLVGPGRRQERHTKVIALLGLAGLEDHFAHFELRPQAHGR
jgi:hypothetical protein